MAKVGYKKVRVFEDRSEEQQSFEEDVKDGFLRYLSNKLLGHFSPWSYQIILIDIVKTMNGSMWAGTANVMCLLNKLTNCSCC